jgi:hypothetical protein
MARPLRRDALRSWFWADVACGFCTGGLAILTLISPEWIEAVFGVHPDHGTGRLEWMMAFVLAVLTFCLAIAARIQWRAAAASPDLSGVSAARERH